MIDYIYLSYNLNENLSAYGNGDIISIDKLSDIDKGSTSNNTKITMPTHYGTHVDFPYHFSSIGKNGSSYSANDFVFDRVQCIFINCLYRSNKILSENDFKNLDFNLKNTDLILVKTNYCKIRNSTRYWKNNPGFAPEVAPFLKAKFPKIRALGFDSISLSNYQNRDLGRLAHKKFLCENDILIIEDMDLNNINNKVKINHLIASPLRFQNADGAPMTVIAGVEID